MESERERERERETEREIEREREREREREIESLICLRTAMMTSMYINCSDFHFLQYACA